MFGVTDQVTGMFAVNGCVPPTSKLASCGTTETLGITVTLSVRGGDGPCPFASPQTRR
jgi:hypothetical protein